ncbi:MAG: glycoside hydrolase family 2 [Cyanobacteria bacterium SZAS LIN-2]|nr:glycoside hydrolase family 2 [Cyanobacteria bacterium SZAS LIN-2]
MKTRNTKTGKQTRFWSSTAITSQAEDYPRPQLRRENWINLDGQWQFAIDHDASFEHDEVPFGATNIIVPFAPETPASQVGDTGFYKAVWYRRNFETPALNKGERLVLHFGAVDWSCDVYVNGLLAGSHEGGYTPFSLDITRLLNCNSGEQTVTVRAHDDPHDMSKPRGKQDWRRDAHSIWYPRTTGIWQTVWMEVQPKVAIKSLRWSADVASWSIGLNAEFTGSARGLSLRVVLKKDEQILADDRYSLQDNVLSRRIELPDPGIEDERFGLLWSPEHPQLITAELTLSDSSGRSETVIDRVVSYTAMRTVSVDHERFILNGRPYHLALVLDQGYWEESGLTAPDANALRRDVELVKALGFNGVRKHQKIEDPRFLFLADKLGLMVWEEMPSPYAFNQRAQERLLSTWTEAIRRDISHPGIVAWVPYNESWGLPDLPLSAAQRDSQRALYYLTRSLDPSRPVIGNDGWEMVAGDIIAVHDYDGDSQRMAARYSNAHTGSEAREHLLKSERPGSRELVLDGFDHSGKPVMLTEFGGICFSRDEGAWGYKRAGSVEEFARQYQDCIQAVRAPRVFAGFCYTQFTDTYQEANGLLYMDRSPKYDIGQIARHTRGER